MECNPYWGSIRELDAQGPKDETEPGAFRLVWKKTELDPKYPPRRRGKSKNRITLKAVLILLGAALLLASLVFYIKDRPVTMVQKAVVGHQFDMSTMKSGKEITFQECVKAFTGSNGTWTKEGDTVRLTSGTGDRSIKARFTRSPGGAKYLCKLDTKGRVYVLAFTVGSYSCESGRDVSDFLIDLTSAMSNRYISMKIPWTPGTSASREASEWMASVLNPKK